jgi:hypothetical protein
MVLAFRERSPAAEFLGVALLTLTAPFAYGLAVKDLSVDAWSLWLLNALYFGASIYYVKMIVRTNVPSRNSPRSYSRYRMMAMGYLSFAAAVLLLVALTGMIPAFSLLAFIPMYCYVIYRMARPGGEMNIRHEGIAQTVLAVVFGLALIAVYTIS